MELRGRTALVTGAGHRIGRAIAVTLGGRGMRVAVHYNAAADGALTLYGEFRSISAAVERVPLLRALDSIGRVSDGFETRSP